MVSFHTDATFAQGDAAERRETPYRALRLKQEESQIFRSIEKRHFKCLYDAALFQNF